MDIKNNGVLNSLVSNNFLKGMSDKKLNLEQSDIKLNQAEINLSLNEEMKLLLNNLNLTPTKENIDLLNVLLKNSIALTDTNIKTIIQATKMSDQNAVEKALFLISNKMNPTKENLGQIEKYIMKDININNQIENIFKELSTDKEFEKIFKDIVKTLELDIPIEDLQNSLENIKSEITENIVSEDLISKFENFSNIKDTKDILKNLSDIFKDNRPLKNTIIKDLDNIFDNDIAFDKSKLEFLAKVFVDDKNFDLKNDINIKTEDFKQMVDNFLKKDVPKQELETLKNIFNIIKNDKEIMPKINNLLENANMINDKIKQKFSFDFEKGDVKELNEFFNEINEIGNNIKKHISETPQFSSSKVLDCVKDMEKNLNFMNDVKDGVFMQIPVCINQFSTTAELFVFADKKSSKNKSKGSSGSALLSLNLANLGKLEAYINKVSNDIFCQFRLEDEQIKDFVRENIAMLDSYLKEKNLNLKDVVIKDLEESFNILTNYENKANDDIKLSAFNVKA